MKTNGNNIKLLFFQHSLLFPLVISWMLFIPRSLEAFNIILCCNTSSSVVWCPKVFLTLNQMFSFSLVGEHFSNRPPGQESSKSSHNEITRTDMKASMHLRRLCQRPDACGAKPFLLASKFSCLLINCRSEGRDTYHSYHVINSDKLKVGLNFFIFHLQERLWLRVSHLMLNNQSKA